MADTEVADLLDKWGSSNLTNYFKDEILTTFLNQSISQLRDAVPYSYERFDEFKETYIRACIKRGRTDEDGTSAKNVSQNTPSDISNLPVHSTDGSIPNFSEDFLSHMKENEAPRAASEPTVTHTAAQNTLTPLQNVIFPPETGTPSENESHKRSGGDVALDQHDLVPSNQGNSLSVDNRDPLQEIGSRLGAVHVENTNTANPKKGTKRAANRKPICKAVLAADKVSSLKTVETLYDECEYPHDFSISLTFLNTFPKKLTGLWLPDEKNLLYFKYFKYLNGTLAGKIVLLHYKTTGKVLRQSLSNVIMEEEVLNRLMDSKDLE